MESCGKLLWQGCCSIKQANRHEQTLQTEIATDGRTKFCERYNVCACVSVPECQRNCHYLMGTKLTAVKRKIQ